MNPPITIRAFESGVRIETGRGEPEDIPIRDVRKLIPRTVNAVAHVYTEYGQQLTQSETDQKRTLRTLASVGYQLATWLLNGKIEVFRNLVQQNLETDIQVLEDTSSSWIPWELLYLGDPKEAQLNTFLGFGRNIYRVSRATGRRPKIAPVPSVGFCAYREARGAQDEHETLRQHSSNLRIKYPSWFHDEQRRDLLANLAPLDIVHFAGLMIPVQCLNRSYIVADTDLWISVDDFTLSSKPSFAFGAAPLILLNVRDDHARNPQHVRAYVERWIDKGAAGVIASEFPVPPALALQFAKHFYYELLELKKPVGQALLEAKRNCIKNYHNPFVMFYAPYFHPSEQEKESAMNQETYADFSLHIGPDGHAHAHSDEGEREATISLVIPEEINLAVDLIEQNKTSETLLKRFGKLLYKSIFPDAIDKHLNQTEAVARNQGRKLRIRLNIEPEKLAQLPWEFLYREERGHFLAINPDTVLSHYLNLSMPPGYVRRREGPLHMLAIIADPTDQTRLPPDEWEAIIKAALAGPMNSGQMTLQTVKRATRKDIRNALLQQKPDIIQFVGHGIYQDGKGYLALVDEETGKTWMVDDERFANLYLGYSDHLGLISLATCESAKSDNPQGFLGIAPKLVERGVPAVLAMRYEVRIKTAKIFLEDFYSVIAARKPVDWATQSARNAISQVLGFGNREFATPVLFMRAKDGNIF